MSFRLKSLRSKFSKRIFGLFMLSALIPVIIIFLMSLNYISEQLDNETRRQLYRESRALGLSLYDRLLTVENNLEIIAGGLNSGINPDQVYNSDSPGSVFSSVYILQENGTRVRLSGNSEISLQFRNNEIEHLENDNTLLVGQLQDQEASGLYMVRMIKWQADRAYLVGQIDAEFLWRFGIYSPEFVCVLDNTGYAIFCSLPGDSIERRDYFKYLINTEKEELPAIRLMGQEYVANAWNVFLEASFGTEDLFIVLAVPRETAFAAFNQYKAIFPQALLATTLLIALLSISQIRKSLIPLEKLSEGTRRVSRGEFNKPVVIKSGDEFEDLATAFNDMTRRIDEQIKTTTTLAEIDRMILSSLDSEYIVETLIRHLHNVIKTNHVCVITINDGSDSAYLNFNIDNEFNNIEKQKINLTRKEIEELEACDNYILLNYPEKRSYFVQQLSSGDKSFIIYPVRIKGKLSGMICLSSMELLELDSMKLQQLRELSDRVAVALSNAAWEEKLYIQAHYDDLTGLPNRYLFRDRFEQALETARRTDGGIAILFIDLDRFKSINDSLGHEFGDKILVHITGILNGCVRKNETLARFGGDEFIILLSSNSRKDITTEASKLSERIIKSMSRSFQIDSQEFYITPSIGIAIYPHDADSYDNLLKNADSAMYNAKSSGRANYNFYAREFNADALMRLELENELRHALRRDEFMLVFQPKINSRTKKIIGVEALLRWQHPEKGLVPPDSFIHIAETTGMITDIGYWALKTACNQLNNWLSKRSIDVHMAVNLSPDQFRQPDLFENINTIISNSGLNPGNLELEITESITIENFSKTINILTDFKQLGVNISIDDFGTGYSSMSYLQKFPINRLKIDQSFIKDIPGNFDSISIIKAIIALAHSLNLSVVCEGIETREQYRILRDLDCDELQGYMISKPLTAQDFEKFYLDNNGFIKQYD